MTKTFARWLEEKIYILLLGFLIFTVVYSASPQTARAEGTHDGKFSAAAGSRVTIYSNLTVVDQTVLATVCVTTAPSGTLAVTIEERLTDGNPVSTVTTLKFGQCTSVALILEIGHVIAIKAPNPTAAAGTYTVSVQLNPPTGP